MKAKDKSLLWRFVIIFVIVGVWTTKFFTGEVKKGLDIAGGSEYTISFDVTKVGDRTVSDVRDQVLEVLSNRVNAQGLKEPILQPFGDAAISLKMPSTDAAEKAEIRALIKQTAKLEFFAVHEDNKSLTAQYNADKDNFEAPIGYSIKPGKPEIDNITKEKKQDYYILKNRPEKVKGSQLDRARVSIGSGGSYTVSLTFDSEGTKAFGDVTSKMIGKPLAIVLDGQVYSAPTIQTAIYGPGQITGNFTMAEAKRLETVLNSGNLPVSIEIDSVIDVDPTLGDDSVQSGTNAAIYGLVGVFVFMIIYYMASGVIASIALAANILLIMGTLVVFNATLTLPGIAGIVLTIGMAVDANVIIFERIREELEKGKSIANAIHYGFDRAFVTIIDANLTTLLTAGILYKVGTDSIKGFAVTLGIGIIASMFTALFMTRAIFDFLLKYDAVKKLKMLQLFKKPNIDFLGKRKIAAIISVSLIALGLISAGVRGKDSLSVDFLGGAQVSFKTNGSVDLQSEEVSALFAKNGITELKENKESASTDSTVEKTEGNSKGIEGVRVDVKDGGKMLAVTFPSTVEDIKSNDFTDRVSAVLVATYPEAGLEFAGLSEIGSTISGKFQQQAIIAMIFAVIGIMIYISFRFEFKFAIAANVALVHDVLIATGIYLLCGRQISLPIIAAILTIIGYSLNDTIVVFDRIREDLGLMKDKSYTEIINLSINQTLSRTVLTSFTTLIVVVILFVFGGGAIEDFALVMLLGVIVGTYSSIFVASSVVSIWNEKEEAKEKEAPAVEVVEA